MLGQAGMGTLSSPCRIRSVSELELSQLESENTQKRLFRNRMIYLGHHFVE